MKVAGRTSSFQFKGAKADLRQVGEKLGVSTVLEGSVRQHKSVDTNWLLVRNSRYTPTLQLICVHTIIAEIQLPLAIGECEGIPGSVYEEIRNQENRKDRYLIRFCR